MTHGAILPVTEYMASTPVLCSAGTCFVHEPRGATDGVGRYIYAIFNRTNFWRYDTWSDAWQQLASPPNQATAVFGAGVAMCICASRDLIYLFTPANAGSFAFLERYTVATDTWAGLNTATLALGGQWGTDAQLLHLCRLENPTVSTPLDLAGTDPNTLLDDHIYLIGNGSIILYRYSIGGNAWTPLVGPLAPVPARGGAPGTGATLNWMPDVLNPDVTAGRTPSNNNILYSFRGGGSGVLDSFNIATNGWAAVAYVPPATPALETFTTGTCSVYDVTDNPSITVYRNATMTLRALSFENTTTTILNISPMGTFAGTDGVAHVGNLLTYVRIGDGSTYYYMAKHSEQTFMRILRTA